MSDLVSPVVSKIEEEKEYNEDNKEMCFIVVDEEVEPNG